MYFRFLILILLQATAFCYLLSPVAQTRICAAGQSRTALFAHHVNKKITKRMMDRRPKKSRPSDIFRNNVNFDKCITKLANSPADYTMICADDSTFGQLDATKFWTSGDPNAEWLEITDEDKVLGLSPNVEPLAKEAIRKKPPLVRSGTW